jgi:hypothetical protein
MVICVAVWLRPRFSVEIASHSPWVQKIKYLLDNVTSGHWISDVVAIKAWLRQQRILSRSG